MTDLLTPLDSMVPEMGAIEPRADRSRSTEVNSLLELNSRKSASRPHESAILNPQSSIPLTPPPCGLVLSLFPGIDLLGLGFELEGYCVLRGPDLIYGRGIESFHLPVTAPAQSHVAGIIAGSPCQDFNPHRGTGEGIRLLKEFARVVTESGCEWFLLENVPTVPDLAAVAPIPGYSIQRFDLNANGCGLDQDRLRHFQFGSVKGLALAPERSPSRHAGQATCIATEGRRGGRARSWTTFCELQGLPPDFDLPGFTRAAKFQAVGNGVPVAMARVIARSVTDALTGRANPQLRLAVFDPAAAIAESQINLRTVTIPGCCPCGCGRALTGKQRTGATDACRQRMSRRLRGQRRPSEQPRSVTV